jgi:hypothetical protein
VRHRRYRRQQLRDRRTEYDAQLVALRAQLALHGQAPGAEGVVGVEQFDAVQPDFGVGVQAFEYQVAARGLQCGARGVEARAVLPVGQAYPLQPGFGRAHVRVGNQPVREQVGMHRARHRRRAPWRRLGMRGQLRVAGHEAEGPALVDREPIGRSRHARPCGKGKA